MNSLYFGAFLTGISGFILLARNQFTWKSDLLWAVAWVANCLVSTVLTWCLTGDLSGLLSPAVASLLFGLLVRTFVPLMTSFGAGLLSCKFYLPIAGMILVHKSVDTSNWPTMALIGYYALQSLFLASAVIGTLFNGCSLLAEFCFRYPKRDNAIKTIVARDGNKNPKVSIHVPCYAEPPELLIATLNAISRLRYANFEVLVIDNNTKDPGLWKPVAAHCKKLGERFRFFHVDPLSGAKAGAVNFALHNAAPDAEIIAVIDADYIADSDFLERFIPLFNDPKTGFVQTSHDYREWIDNPFLSGTYYEYMPVHKLGQPVLSEYDAGYTVGTMCLVRRKALEMAGGWAEWALTEDSELAVRIHALGYTGHVFTDTAGRGLIPETMDGVKKQQFRWTAGPVQQFLVHWRLYLGLGGNGRLSFAQKVLEIRHSFDRLPVAIAFVMGVPMLLYCLYAILNRLTIPVPHGVMAVIAAAVYATYLEKWIAVKRLGCRRIRDFVLSVMMQEALRWTYLRAFIVPFFRMKLAWHRTDKFSKSRNFLRVLDSSRAETSIALIHFAIAALLVPFAHFRQFDYVALVLIGMFVQGIGFLCTLIMTVISERALRVTGVHSGPIPVPVAEEAESVAYESSAS
ncbi:MAG: glycosyltransferase [Paraburkholderia sp.]|uniref:glycosyltransferase n=1 Tax=Paraburkholderia sp. TaxID=1926495 RepID=UPI003C5BC273